MSITWERDLRIKVTDGCLFSNLEEDRQTIGERFKLLKSLIGWKDWWMLDAGVRYLVVEWELEQILSIMLSKESRDWLIEDHEREVLFI